MKINTDDLSPKELEMFEESKILTAMMGSLIMNKLKDKPAIDALNIGALAISNVLANFSRTIINVDDFGHQLELIDDISRQARRILRTIREEVSETKQ